MTPTDPAPQTASSAVPVVTSVVREVERVLTAFEEAWQDAPVSSLEPFLSRLTGVDAAEFENGRRLLLEELIKIDLEYRWRQDEPAGLPNKRWRLEDYLQAYPFLGPRDDLPARLIAEEYRVRHRWGDRPGIEEYQARFPAHVGLFALLKRHDHELDVERIGNESRKSHSTVRERPASSADAIVHQDGEDLVEGEGFPVLPDYEFLEVLGRGGMGVVYKARQTSLGRMVAVKTILSGAHADQQERRRFRREAEAVARLQHPNIVQIHEVGERDGQPYLILEYVANGSLAQRLAVAPLPPLAAARLVETVSRALQYAHEQGLVHRDVKPANILLESAAHGPSSAAKTSHGNEEYELIPKITDFGLVKKLDADTAHGTQSGAILGTPGYMAPEQAAGDPDSVGPTTDVYALGAVLYEGLTGRPPFKAASVLETLEQVRHAEPLPPRRLQPSVPRDLETICLRCLQKHAGKRYASARALADDLRRYQNGEPIEARPVGSMERLWKWTRRRPALAALLAVSVAACIILAVGDQQYKARLIQARVQAESQRDRADANLQLAREAVDKTISKIADNPRLQEADFHQLRHDLLENMVPFYEQFVMQQGNHPGLIAERGRAYSRLAFVRQEMGEKAQALADYEEKRVLFARLVEESPAHADYRRELAHSHADMAVLLRQTGRLTDAEANFDQAILLQKQLIADFPGASEYSDDLAKTCVRWGELLVATGRQEKGEAAYLEALSLRKKLVSEDPRSPSYLEGLAGTQYTLGRLLLATGRLKEAEVLFRDALAGRKQLATEQPAVAKYREKWLGATVSWAFW
jgi:serine/threonine protein kinase/tetratricopeptide (TPR) repeat protein